MLIFSTKICILHDLPSFLIQYFLHFSTPWILFETERLKFSVLHFENKTSRTSHFRYAIHNGISALPNKDSNLFLCRVFQIFFSCRHISPTSSSSSNCTSCTQSKPYVLPTPTHKVIYSFFDIWDCYKLTEELVE